MNCIDVIIKISIPVASFILAMCVPLIIYTAINSRKNADGTYKGIGWQFIRYVTIAISLPIAALLAINNVLTGEVATLIAGAMGYAFGKSGDSTSSNNKPSD